MRIKVLIEPVAQYAPRGFQPADLHAFGFPAWFAVEDGEGRPADCEVVFGWETKRRCVGSDGGRRGVCG